MIEQWITGIYKKISAKSIARCYELSTFPEIMENTIFQRVRIINGFSVELSNCKKKRKKLEKTYVRVLG